MSTIKVTNIDPPSAGGAVNVNGLGYPNAGPLSNRNFVINGGMVVAQRGTSVSVANAGEYIVDRFAYRRNGAWGSNSFTMTQESSGAPDNFTHFLRLTQSGTAATPPTDAQCRLATYLEGNTISSAGFGTSAAKDLTLSWYAKASIAGTYCVALTNNVIDQSFIAEYSVTTSWQRFEVTIPARTTGTWSTDNTIGFRITFTVAGDTGGALVGSTGWTATGNLFTTNQLETFASTSGATFDLCGVQLEVGSQATPFEHRSYVDELRRCQRYLFRIQGNSSDQSAVGIGFNHTTDDCRVVFQLPVAMRERNQTCTESGLESLYTSTGTVGLTVSGLDENVHAVGLTCTADTGTPFTVGRANFVRLATDATAFFQIESEF